MNKFDYEKIKINKKEQILRLVSVPFLIFTENIIVKMKKIK